MIVLDTTILVYAKGAEHPLRDSCRALIESIARGRVHATTTPEVIQEFVHVRARRRTRRDAAALGRSFADLLSPLLTVGDEALVAGLRLFERHPMLGAFDAVLVAAAIRSEADGLASADSTFAGIRGMPHILPGSPEFDALTLG